MMLNKRYRRSKNNIKKALLIFMMLLFSSLVLASCTEKEEKKKSPESVQDFSDGLDAKCESRTTDRKVQHRDGSISLTDHRRRAAAVRSE